MADSDAFPFDRSWSAYERLVIDKLATLDNRMQALENQQILTRIDVAKLKVKAGLWGAAAGFIPAALAMVVAYIGGT